MFCYIQLDLSPTCLWNTMSGMDALIAKSLGAIVKDNLGDATFRKIEQRIFERHGMGFTQASADFGKLDSVLREFFGSGAEGIERQILEKIVNIEKSVNNEKRWVTLEDSHLIETMLKAIGDEDKKNIINAVIDKPLIISEILEISKIPQTSGYRKVNSLIENGILIPQGYVTTHDGKQVTMYKAIFENISITMEKNKVVVKVQPTMESIKDSSVMQIVCS
jgi:hypothetical protein